MTALESMSEKLRQTGLYEVDSGMIHMELCAYAAGLDILYEMMNEWERECFLDTAVGEGLTRREAECSRSPVGKTIDQRRKALGSVRKLLGTVATPQSLEILKDLFCVQGDWTEDFANRKMIFKSKGLNDAQKIKLREQLSEYLPIEMTVEVQ